MTTAPTESRFRVSVFFPIRHESSYYQTLNWLTKRLNRKYEGVTLSIHQPLPVFRGFYFVENKRVLKDRIVLLISDVEVLPNYDVEELEKSLREIKRRLHEKLPDEDEFWIAYHPITRIIEPKRRDIYPPDPPSDALPTIVK
jgi:hypothetical protein